ncbi:MAG TPA: hypothetical protein PLS49_02810 [Candidatus Woesebacteria bacterium]|nr:hypothetical protein [Candidatus Woesebacteria bacterium]
MKEIQNIGILVAKTALALSLSACGGEIQHNVNAQSNATPIPQEIFLGCKKVQFGDTGLGIAFAMGGDANSSISINGGEKMAAFAAPILPLNEQHGIQPEICVYDMK